MGYSCIPSWHPDLRSGEKVKVYESFVEGAKGGFQMAIRIIPYLVAILVAIGMLRAAGAIDILAAVLDPVLRYVGFPVEILPLAIMRPLSGSGSLGMVTELINVHGPIPSLGALPRPCMEALKRRFTCWLCILVRSASENRACGSFRTCC